MPRMWTRAHTTTTTSSSTVSYRNFGEAIVDGSPVITGFLEPMSLSGEMMYGEGMAERGGR